ncbi:MAG: hypothetical protein IFJ96_01120, partial [Acidobacteria bacterium]|nr:hypothetical protein [Candidatus Sulfomarinibacter sp. MAG AM2]
MTVRTRLVSHVIEAVDCHYRVQYGEPTDPRIEYPDRKVLTSKYANFLKTCAYTADQVVEALGVPERARKILHAQWTYIGPPTSRLNFTIYGAMLYKFLETSAYIPRQRS